jgi:hypothetical protein
MRIVLPTLLAVLALAPAAAAQTGFLERAAAALATTPVYVDPGAEAALTAAEAQALRERIRSSEAGPMYVAILPASAVDAVGGSPDVALETLLETLRREGTYVLVAGNTIRVGSTLLRAAPLADEAVAEHRSEGLAAILGAFVDKVEEERIGAGSGTVEGTGLALLGVLVVGGGGVMLARRSRRRREEAHELDVAKDQVRDELVALGDGLRELDLDVEMPGADPAAKEDYGRAVGAYDRANQAWTTARHVDDLAPVGAALEEGRWAIASARARLEGHAPPERRAPCFFDPRHGPSTRDVEWAPPGGAPRAVPACEADAQTVEQGIDPGFRQVLVNGSSVPYWAAGPQLSPFYAGGMFGGFGIGTGLLGGLMLGSMLTPGLAWGAGFGDGDAGFGGDFGAGDFGGGDFGGDFGGGDFGGGDF